LEEHLVRLLEALIVRAALVPLGAYPIRAAASVPTDLRKIAKLAVHSGRAWSCWTHGSRTWMFTGQIPLELSRERGAPVLQVDVYDDDGLKDSSGLWMPDRAGNWQRCAD
jgi:hypothetical protein